MWCKSTCRIISCLCIMTFEKIIIQSFAKFDWPAAKFVKTVGPSCRLLNQAKDGTPSHRLGRPLRIAG